jgi:hypothetical protein
VGPEGYFGVLRREKYFSILGSEPRGLTATLTDIPAARKERQTDLRDNHMASDTTF